ncbi:MAG: late competence development ComFB family protein [Eubacteriaceae bacterium]
MNTNEEKVHLKNFTENLVDESIDKLLKNMDDICKCERCKNDIKALALNQLPPKYTVTEKGETYTKINSLENQIRVDILREVLNAIIVVKKNCSHSGENDGEY